MQRGLPIAQKLVASQANPKYKDYLAGVHGQTGSIQNQAGDLRDAATNFRIAASIREPIARVENADPIFRTHLAGDYIGLATALHRLGEAIGI